MSGTPHGNTMVRVQMDRILESAVVLSWKDLLNASHRGLIHIEYAPGARLPYLKIWHLTARGEWRLFVNTGGRVDEPIAQATG